MDEIEEYSKTRNRFVFINSDRPNEPLKSSDSLNFQPRKIYTIVEQIPEMKESLPLVHNQPNHDLQVPTDIENVLSESILTNEHIRTTL